MDYIETIPVFLIGKMRGHSKFILRGQQLFWMEISTGPWRIFEQADTGPYTILYGKINGAMANFTTGHRSFPNPVFPKIMTGPQIHAPNDFIHDLIHDFILWSKNAILFSLIRYGKQIDFSDFET